MNSLPDKSSRRRSSSVDPSDDAPTRIVLGGDARMADSHDSTAELAPASPRRGSSIVVISDEAKTVISKRSPVEDPPPPIHVGPLESRRALEGETLDHFKLETFVGGGGMGAVYRSYDTRLNRLVAVKILSRDQSDSETVRRFRNEAQSAARLDHANIARVYYVGEDKGWNFIVFEFIEGVNLREIVEKQGPLPFEQALDVTFQVAEALDHAAARDVVHRDIKPSNVLVTNDGSAKLVDMGLARLHQVESSADDLTQSGVTLGTFDYISPEQARDPRLADVRSDIYSLGCTLYFMLVGRPPFPEGTALQKLLRHNGDDPPDVRLFRPETPEEVVAILTRSLAKKPEQRFQTPAELMAAIHRVSQRLHLNLGDSSSRVTVAWPQPNASDSPWWWRFAPLGVAVLILVVLALLPDLSGPSTPDVGLPEGKRTTPAAIPVEVAKLPSSEPIEEKTSTDEPESSPGSNASSISQSAPPTTSVASSGRDAAGSSTLPAPSPRESPVDPLETMPRIDVPIMPVVETPAKRRVVVRTDMMSIADADAVLLPNLAEALYYASQHREVDTIELAFSGKQTIASTLDIASKQLTIKAATGFVPELVFRPSQDATSADRRLIRQPQPASSVNWEGIRIRLEIPAAADWAVFHMVHDATLTLESCAVTIAQPIDSVGMQTQQVSFVEVERSHSSNDTSAGEVVDTLTGHVSLNRCIMRGNGNVVRVTEDAPLYVQLTECFVSTNHRLLETAGASSRPLWMERIRLDVDRSTIHAANGLALIGSNSELPNRMEVRIDPQESVFLTGRQAPLIEYRSIDAVEEPRVLFEGTDNFYPRSELFFVHRYLHDGIEVEAGIPFGELPRWAMDRNAGKGTIVSTLPTTPTSEHSATDYVVKSSSGSVVGCDPAMLQQEGTSRRSTGMGTMETMKMDPRNSPMSGLPE